MGPAVGLVAAFLWMLFSITLFGVASESGMRAAAAVRIGLVGSLSTVALLGLVQLLPIAGWIAALAVGLTCPPLLDRLSAHMRRATIAVGRCRSRTPRAHDQAAVDRVFTQIVADLDRDVT
jgi:hypothetical protein